MERVGPSPAREAREGLFLPLKDTRLVKRSLPGGKSRRLWRLAARLGAEPEGARLPCKNIMIMRCRALRR